MSDIQIPMEMESKTVLRKNCVIELIMMGTDKLMKIFQILMVME